MKVLGDENKNSHPDQRGEVVQVQQTTSRRVLAPSKESARWARTNGVDKT